MPTELNSPLDVPRYQARRILLLLAAVAIANLWWLVPERIQHVVRADEPPVAEDAAIELPAGEPPSDDAAGSVANGPIRLPATWPAGHPVPTVKSNCMVCHLNAGRELTLAVKDFARSTHDFQGLTCHDCHGGNAEIDAHAHEDEFGFIGTKLSAHLKTCSGCHEEQALVLATGPHHWDFSKRINTKYPMCIDCHGNHDVGNPPDDFSLKSMCQECHESLDVEMPQLARVADQNDRLWRTLVRVRARQPAAGPRDPPALSEEIAALRSDSMQWVHVCRELTPEDASALNERSEQLREKLEQWLAGTE